MLKGKKMSWLYCWVLKYCPKNQNRQFYTFISNRFFVKSKSCVGGWKNTVFLNGKESLYTPWSSYIWSAHSFHRWKESYFLPFTSCLPTCHTWKLRLAKSSPETNRVLFAHVIWLCSLLRCWTIVYPNRRFTNI